MSWNSFRILCWAFVAGAGFVLVGCQSPQRHSNKADSAADAIVARQQQELFERDAAFSIERPADVLRRRLLLDQDLPHAGPAALGTDQLEPIPHWPAGAPGLDADNDAVVAREQADPVEPLHLNLSAALEIGARNAREYQDRKEDVFRAALQMDVEAFRFRNQYLGQAETTYTEDRSGDDATRGVVHSMQTGVSRTFQMGAALSSRIAFDLVKLLTLDRDSAYGLMADLSVTVPLLRGAGRHVVAEPLTQAERNVMYAMYALERFKQRYAVRVATEYLQVLQQADQVRNAEENLERVGVSAARARRLGDAGRLPEIQVDQAQQEELRARERWLNAMSTYERRLDQFKITLGLPADALVELDSNDLAQLTERMQQERAADATAEEQNQSPLEAWPSRDAIALALDQRMDLLVSLGRVFDAQRAVTVAANDLRWRAQWSAGATAGARRGLGSAGQGDASLNVGDGVYSSALELELPWSRTAQRNAYRDSFIALERATRQVQELEDQIKVEVRNAQRVLRQARQTMVIQARSVELAQRRVDSTELFLQAGRAQIRDVLEAQEALVSARDGLTSAVVTYRLAELELQRDMGVLAVDDQGLWTEYTAWGEAHDAELEL